MNDLQSLFSSTIWLKTRGYKLVANGWSPEPASPVRLGITPPYQAPVTSSSRNECVGTTILYHVEYEGIARSGRVNKINQVA